MASIWVHFRRYFSQEKDSLQSIFCSSGVRIWRICLYYTTHHVVLYRSVEHRWCKTNLELGDFLFVITLEHCQSKQ
jgi:hypothetical protein